MIEKFHTQTKENETWYSIVGLIKYPETPLNMDKVLAQILSEISNLLGYHFSTIDSSQKESTPAPTPTPQVKPDLQLTAEPFNLISNNDFLESLVGKYTKISKDVYCIKSFYLDSLRDNIPVLLTTKVAGKSNQSKDIHYIFNDVVDVFNDIECTDYFHNALEYRKGNL